jgi:hypothetical protein
MLFVTTNASVINQSNFFVFADVSNSFVFSVYARSTNPIKVIFCHFYFFLVISNLPKGSFFRPNLPNSPNFGRFMALFPTRPNFYYLYLKKKKVLIHSLLAC